jgi:hemerythrin-like domain-containing protein
MPSIGFSARASFDRPLDTLMECHERIRTQCDALRRLAMPLPADGGGATERKHTAANLIWFFGTTGRYHHEDEEADLFPAMIAAATGPYAERVASLVQRLEAQHRELEDAWGRLSGEVKKIADGAASVLDEREVARFNAAYREHSTLEETELIPLAEMILSAPECEVVGRCIARRHGVAPGLDQG